MDIFDKLFKTSKSQNLVVKCHNCGTVYDIRKGAYVETITLKEALEQVESQGIIVTGAHHFASEFPDVWYTTCRATLPKKECDRLLKESIQKIGRSLARNQKREWRCHKCNTIQQYRLKAESKLPKPDVGCNNKGLELFNLGRYEEALKVYEKAIEMEPGSANLWCNKGMALFKLERFVPESIEAFNKAIELNKDDFASWTYRGLILHRLGKFEKALKALDKALEIQPNYSDALDAKRLILGTQKENKAKELRKKLDNLDMKTKRKIWKRLSEDDERNSALSQSPDSQTTTNPNYGELFNKLLQNHLKRIEAGNEQHRRFIRDYLTDKVVRELTIYAHNKMVLTQADQEEHSFAMSQTPVSYWICTVALTMDDAKSWFERRYGGYIRLLNEAMDSVLFRSSHCEVLVHIVFGRSKQGGWVNMSISPLSSSRFGFIPIFPVELLTEGEKRILNYKN